MTFEGFWFFSLAVWGAEAHSDTIDGLAAFSTSFALTIAFACTVDLSKVVVGVVYVAHCL